MHMMFMTKKHMGVLKFLKELKLVAEYFKWTIDTYIRGCNNGMSFCPITAVTYATKGINYSLSEWHLAAEELNMPQEIAEAIVKASDGGILFNAESATLHELLLQNIKEKYDTSKVYA